MRNHLTFAILAISGSISSAIAQPAAAPSTPKPGLSITIYSSAEPGGIPASMYRPVPASMGGSRYGGPIPGYALVRRDSSFDLAEGVGTLRLSDVAALIDPTTVSFTSLSDPSTSVLEQNFQFDLVSTEKLMERYLGQKVTLIAQQGQEARSYVGTLLSSSGSSAVLQAPGGGVSIVNNITGVSLDALPGGLITRPTLVWSVRSAKAGPQNVRVSYQTEGITWWADYNLVYSDGADANSGAVDVGAWVSILNQSGASYNDATLKLIAGDVQRTAPQNVRVLSASRGAGADMAELGFQEKSFFEYHLYTLGRPATIPENSTKQVELFPVARGVPCEKVLVYDGLGGELWGGGGPMTEQGFGVQSKPDVDIYLRLANAREKGLGMPLPAGRLRVSKLDPADGSLEFIGEDTIRHTAREEKVMVRLGHAFDVVGERRQVDFRVDTSRREMTETIEVKVRNRKAEPVKVIVQERMYRWAGWELMKHPEDFQKLDARTVHFPVSLKKDEQKTIQYTVRYTW